MKLLIGSDAASNAAYVPDALALARRDEWVRACTERLIELRPSREPSQLRAVALDMVDTLAYFDPVMAAEMEHEGGMLDD